MYFVAIILIMIVYSVFKFIDDIFGDMVSRGNASACNNKFYYDHNNTLRFTRTGSEVNLRTQSEEDEYDRNIFNEQSKQNAIKNNKSVYEYKFKDDKYKCLGTKYIDLKTEKVYAVRVISGTDIFYKYYMDVETGLYIREADSTLSFPNQNDDGSYGREDAIKTCEKHNLEIIEGTCKEPFENYRSNKDCLLKYEREMLNAVKLRRQTKIKVAQDTDYKLQRR